MKILFHPMVVGALLGAGPVLAQGAKAPDVKLSAPTQNVIDTRCSLCHGKLGESASAIYPRLAGQHPAYLETQLREFGKRERTNENAVMHTVASKLTEFETHAVAVYLGA